MAQLGKYKVPRELQDEDKWFKFFTKKQLATAIVIIFIDWQIVTFFYNIHMVIVGITLALFFTIVCGAVVSLKMPNNRHLHGGGVGLDALAIRIMKRKLIKKNKIIYTSCLRNEEGD